MRILVLGGTVFLGRHVAAAALARGHELTLFTRGLHGADLFPEAERLHGDRAATCRRCDGREWDAVIDTSGYEPEHVGRLGERLADGRPLRVRLLGQRLPGLAGRAGRRGLAGVGGAATTTGRRRRRASGRPRRRCRAAWPPCARG